MKTSSTLLAILAVTAFAFSPIALHAQDQPPPPPPMDNGAQPPPPDGSAPPPPPDAGAPAPDQGGDSGASFQQFYDQLGSQGSWVQTDDYGYVFQPTVTDPNWAPYTEGHWVYTDVGWTWASDEPWGWATYHYGRWVNIDGAGWAWVPGTEWAPAWVSWRYGGGYCGWAPLPPATLLGVDFAAPGVNIGIGFSFGAMCDTEFGIGPGCYNFIPVTFIGDPYYRGHYLDRGRNFVVINQTRNITNTRYYSGRPTFGGVTVGGPRLEDVNAVAHTHVEQVRLAAGAQAGRGTVAGGTLTVFAPRFNAATVHQARPANVAQHLTAVKVNRGTSISHPLAVNASLKPVAPSAAAIAAAKEAQAKAPASAHIATSKTVPKTTLSKPLTSLQTASEQRRAAPPSPATLGAHPSVSQEHPSTPSTSNAGASAEQQRQATLQKEQTEAKERAVTTQQKEQTQTQQRAAATQQERDANLEKEQAATRERAATEQQRTTTEQQQQHAATQERSVTPSQSHPPVTQEHAPAQQQQHAPVQQEQHERAPAQGNGERNSGTGTGGR